MSNLLLKSLKLRNVDEHEEENRKEKEGNRLVPFKTGDSKELPNSKSPEKVDKQVVERFRNCKEENRIDKNDQRS